MAACRRSIGETIEYSDDYADGLRPGTTIAHLDNGPQRLFMDLCCTATGHWREAISRDQGGFDPVIRRGSAPIGRARPACGPGTITFPAAMRFLSSRDYLTRGWMGN